MLLLLYVNTFTSKACKFPYVNKKESLGQRIKRLRIAAGFETQDALAKAIGCERATVTMWEGDKVKKIGGDYLVPLAHALHASPSLVQSGEDKEQRIRAYEIRAVDGEDEIDPETEVLIPEVDVKLSAGDGHAIPEFVETKRRLPFQRAWLQRKRVKEKDLVLMKVSGDSMLPTLGDGDMVLIDRSSTNIADGKIYAIVAGDDAKIKRLRKLATGMVQILSDNALFPPEELPRNEIGIIGRAIHKSGDL